MVAPNFKLSLILDRMKNVGSFQLLFETQDQNLLCRAQGKDAQQPDNARFKVVIFVL